MRWFAPLLILTSAAMTVPAHAQLVPGGPSGDFRVNDRPGTAPTAGPPGGPSLPPDPTMFRDAIGAKPPDEILKSIDKDLGRSTAERPNMNVQPFDLEREFRSPSDKLK
jgi:hypothetical protein